MKVIAFFASFLLATTSLLAQHDSAAMDEQKAQPSSSSHADCPMMSSDAKHDAMNKRGDTAMGFSQLKTTHHFLLAADGGAIVVSANNPNDQDTIEHVRAHLRHIAKAFAEGDFSIPMAVHDETPPGAEKMKAMRSSLNYSFESVPNGGRVVIRSKNPAAIAAVHDFLRYQIREHRTGDSTR